MFFPDNYRISIGPVVLAELLDRSGAFHPVVNRRAAYPVTVANHWGRWEIFSTVSSHQHARHF
jgi:hypothetical protein